MAAKSSSCRCQSPQVSVTLSLIGSVEMFGRLGRRDKRHLDDQLLWRAGSGTSSGPHERLGTAVPRPPRGFAPAGCRPTALRRCGRQNWLFRAPAAASCVLCLVRTVQTCRERGLSYSKSRFGATSLGSSSSPASQVQCHVGKATGVLA